ncbi:carbohydrate ABC transporter permease [Actinoplanes subtropicus]|uniref:carbohydrate ABC transporter permease n=1 Tax=Actinoplanes subtropicus TaxID=543632 RepID=UPI000A026A88|nr:carbohydrate ABC transporter permease [Actinoplanes subtropicus]
MALTTKVAPPATAARPRRRGRRPGAATDRAGSASRHRRGITRWIVLTLLVVTMLVTLFPFFMAAINAIKTVGDYTAHGPLALPRSFDLTAIKDFWRNVDYTNKLFNSILISGSVAVLGTAISLLNAYALGIGRIKARKALLVTLLLATTIPQEALIYPLYYLAKAVDLYDTRLVVIIISSVMSSAFGTYLLASVLSTFPPEILEAARIDGAGRWQVLRHVVVPVIRPTLAVLMTLFFIWTWNDFFLPLIMLVSNDNQTASVALGSLQGQYTSSPTSLAAASLLGILPAVVFFLIFQRTLTRGAVAGAVR